MREVFNGYPLMLAKFLCFALRDKLVAAKVEAKFERVLQSCCKGEEMKGGDAGAAVRSNVAAIGDAATAAAAAKSQANDRSSSHSSSSFSSSPEDLAVDRAYECLR